MDKNQGHIRIQQPQNSQKSSPLLEKKMVCRPVIIFAETALKNFQNKHHTQLLWFCDGIM